MHYARSGLTTKLSGSRAVQAGRKVEVQTIHNH
jgi:hypothetical protein